MFLVSTGSYPEQATFCSRLWFLRATLTKLLVSEFWMLESLFKYDEFLTIPGREEPAPFKEDVEFTLGALMPLTWFRSDDIWRE